jgi:glycosyltransferase involved in cell wall biosynthesis
VYNRLQHLQQCIDSLAKCDLADDTIVYISSDAAYTDAHSAQIEAIREYILSIRQFKQVVPVFHNTNKGLVKAIHDSVSIIFKEYDTLIFMEDDNIVAPDFLTYMNAGLLFYKNNPRVITVSGFSQSIFFEEERSKINQTYFTHRHCPWGFGIWKDKYLYDHQYSIEDVRKDLKDKNFVARLNGIGIDLLPSFKHLIHQGNMLKADYLFVYHMIKNNLVTVAPYATRSFNTGNDGSGTRTKRNNRFVNFDKSKLLNKVDFIFNESIEQNLNNSFNERLNDNKTTRLKKRLDKLGLLKLGYAFHALKKKWK